MTQFSLQKTMSSAPLARAAAIIGITLIPFGAALADSIELSQPVQAASLHEGGVDMVVYYLDDEGRAEVVATYVTKAAPDDPKRIRMGLEIGDSTTFGLPGEPHVAYTFERRNDLVRVVAAPVSGNLTEVTNRTKK